MSLSVARNSTHQLVVSEIEYQQQGISYNASLLVFYDRRHIITRARRTNCESQDCCGRRDECFCAILLPLSYSLAAFLTLDSAPGKFGALLQHYHSLDIVHV